VLLSTAIVKAKEIFGEYKVCSVLLDNGSESSLITEKCVKLLDLKPSRCDGNITGISSVSVGKAKGVVGMSVSSLIKDLTFGVEWLVFSKVTGRPPSFKYHGEEWEYLRGLPLADPQFLEPRKVDILLETDVTEYLRLHGKVMRDLSSPIAWATELGWIISGTVGVSGLDPNSLSSNLSVRVHHSLVETDAVIRRFWELKRAPDRPVARGGESLCTSFRF
jgi:hypothetical protein